MVEDAWGACDACSSCSSSAVVLGFGMLVTDDSRAAWLDGAAESAVSIGTSVQPVIGRNSNPKMPAVNMRIVESSEMKKQDGSELVMGPF
jgi:hypothetical protein